MSGFDLEAIRTVLSDRTVEHYPVAVSLEALGLEWSRRRDADVGSVILADSEVSPKVRRGLPALGHGPAFAVIVSQDEPEAISTLRGSLALAVACQDLTHRPTTCLWPRSVAIGEELVGAVSIELLPITFGRAVMAFRFDLDSVTPTAMAVSVLQAQQMPADDLLVRYSEVCATLNRQVTAYLTPRGEVTARAVGISAAGALQLEMASGRIADLPIEQALSVDVVGA